MIDVERFYKDYLNIEVPLSHQVEMWTEVCKGELPILLRAPTGSGKTEAVIAPFLNQFIENRFTLAPRLIYILPMRVLINSISRRIQTYAEKISPFISVELQHGDIPNSPFFISDIVVTTLDQFLYGFARTSHQVGHHLDVPAGSIASSLVVFDEAHMYRDPFTFSVMRALMEILYEGNIPFVVMTATMPKGLEMSLFERIPHKTIRGDVDFKNILQLSLCKEPIYSDGEVLLSDELLDKIRSHKTLIILNQVKRAQKVYIEIKQQLGLKDDEIILLHSRFTLKDRASHENTALNLMKYRDNEVRIVVSTQVLEAGLDFSCELLLTELAPADALIQRAGRCARYRGEKGEMMVFQVENERGYKPYKEKHIQETWRWLDNNLGFNIKDFTDTCRFVDILDYRANDYEAGNTLIDLYECVLYADRRPENIQLRDSKPTTLIVVDTSSRRRIEDRISQMDIRKNSISVDIGVAWWLWRKRSITKSLVFEEDKWSIKDVKNILPFSYYLLDEGSYNSELGITNDETMFA